MISKKIYLTFFILLSCVFLSMIDNKYQHLKSISLHQSILLVTDRLSNAYVVVENQLLKYDGKGNPKGNFSKNNSGNLTFIDASNPMKILLFYPDYARIILLDSKLAIQSEVDLRSININQPITICNSGEDGYWIYDREDDQLKKIDNNLKIVFQSGNLTQVVGYQMQPSMMAEDNGFVYINNPSTGILIFDRYGTYYKTLPFIELKNFQVINKDLLFIKDNRLFRYESNSLEQKEILLPENDSIKDVRIEQHELYLLTNDSLKFYYF
jgi:hypothetical protein